MRKTLFSAVFTLIAGYLFAQQSPNISNELFKKVIELKEFKTIEKQIDSLKKAKKMPFDVSIDIVNNSFYKEDVNKNIAVAFINETLKPDHRIVYIVKFDKSIHQIISVKKENKGYDEEL